MEHNNNNNNNAPPANNPQVNRLEAIIRARDRPTVLIQNDTFPTVPLGPFQKQVELAFYMVKNYARSVGRIYAVAHNPRVKMMKYFGTGWLIHDNIMVTNRHVALCFCSTDRTIQPGITVKVNFTAEHLSLVTEEAGIAEVLYLASGEEIDQGVDVAILRLTWPDNHPPRAPIPLETGAVINEQQHPVVVIGHPAYDSRNPDEDMQYYFDNIYDVKRLSPGFAYRNNERPHNPTDIFHDATTLGGSSGSVILSLVTGKAIGLHYGGVYAVANVAVESAKIAEIANRLVGDGRMDALPAPPAPLFVAPPHLEGAFSADELNARTGYNPAFLTHNVPLPTVRPDLQGQLAMNGHNNPEFKYEHFSIVFNQQRKLAFFTAVNIDGRKLVQVRRARDVWKFDSRIPAEYQLSNGFYSNARREGLMFDRGHLVRRLDPCWGDDDQVVNQANEDTFHFTNCTPQHRDLNQKTWLELENYVLNRASDNNFLVTVFTGPVLNPLDGRFDGVQIPSEFWKVVVTLHNNNLFATAYIQTQEKLINNFLEGPERNQPYGRFKTYQVTINAIQEKTGIVFPPAVLAADPLARREANQPAIVEIKDEEDIQLV